ncbi:MAG TPA: hypothetical protein PKM73_01355 [Verrucomicrobiota bacterium]|nr:hypothetical protein [Verrucomicrobiota bacterium]HNU50031.1 hypothetical protein [Verrucomicrobiota bacterium]
MRAFPLLAAWCATLGAIVLTHAQNLTPRQIPAALKDWQDWATWDAKHRHCPTPFNNAAKHVCLWPGELSLTADPKSATWELRVTVFGRTWVPLPGGADTWPLDVRADGAPAAVVEHENRPSLELDAGLHQITGAFRWETEMPQRIRVPREIGLLSLVLEGRKVEIPNWDEAGDLWLKRVRLEATDKDAIAAQVWRVIEDGIPLWLRTELELSVSGKSREEDLGHIVPEGWSIASVDAPVPVAVDDQGRMKAQVRAGKWTVRVDAFRTTDAGGIGFAQSAQPIVAAELVGFRAAPEFRMAELEGLPLVDVSQTTFPQKWRNLPVYQWQTDRAFRLVEKMRGMGRQRPEGLQISRVFWLDEDGKGLTFRDQIRGTMQQIWRLDVAEGLKLGAAKIGGQAQLITVNPSNKAPGVEIRTRNLDMQAIGRSDRMEAIPATGWRSPADGLQVTLNLPPGWRVLALFGADWVEGDWLTAWTLLDLFLLLIFSLAVFKLWGWKAGLVAFLAFGLGYHEPGAPRLSWLFLLLPLALLRVVPDGGVRRGIAAWRWLAIALLLLGLVPFAAGQLQSVLYPQLEPQGYRYGSRPLFGPLAYRAAHRVAAQRAAALPALMPATEALEAAPPEAAGRSSIGKMAARYRLESNLSYESKARIQTGPAEPEWSWNQVHCGWNGPVSADETLRPLLVSTAMHRGLTVLRVALLLLLGGLLLRNRRPKPVAASPAQATGAGAAAALLLALCLPASALAQVPDKEMLNTLRDRLLETADAYPHAADIAAVDLNVTGGRISMTAEIHAALPVAVPLPGRLPSWSPVSVHVDGKPTAVLRREDGYLWIAAPAGVHRVGVEGLLPSATEWEWTFLLKPRRVAIAAPNWTVTGVRPNGIPEDQIFFARQVGAAAGEAAYDRKDFNAIVAVERHLEIGLIWQARTLVTRLSQAGKAVSLRVPLLAGEKVLSPAVIVQDGFVEVRLGAGEAEFGWESELPTGKATVLTAEQTHRWVERWHLVTSPVWNVALSGLAPVFETSERNLVPVWHPWPGESVTLSFSKPEAMSGDTLTVRRVKHDLSLGSRQRTSQLTLDVEASLGDDFILELDPKAEISSLKQDDRPIPVRREGATLVVPVHPGSQTLTLEWRSDEPLGTTAAAGTVKLPVEAANISTVMHVPESRWVLWASGPLRGPAVRFWTVLAVSLLAAWILGGLKLSPLSRLQWTLLALGLTQIHLAAALTVVGWFFLVRWRGEQGDSVAGWRFDLLQLLVAGLTLAALGILVATVREGLLGNPEMFIRGNGSSRVELCWFQPRSGTELPLPVVVSVSVWFYRLLMLAWALWLATALIRWLQFAWMQFSKGGCWKPLSRKPKSPPPLPPGKA